MKSFFKSVLATIIGIFFTFILLFFLIATIGSISSKELKVEKKSILTINLDAPIYDRAEKNPLDGVLPSSLGIEAMGLNVILENILKAKHDDNIKGIYLQVASTNAGITSISEIREALVDFKSSGKFIVSYAEWYTQSAYYLASVADTLYLNPMGDILLKGLSANLTFFKRSLAARESPVPAS